MFVLRKSPKCVNLPFKKKQKTELLIHKANLFTLAHYAVTQISLGSSRQIQLQFIFQ